MRALPQKPGALSDLARRAPAPPFETTLDNPPVPADVGVPAIGPFGPPRELGTAPAPVSTVVTFPWWERPTESSLDFNPLSQNVALPLNGDVLLTQQEVPQGYRAVIRGVNIFALNTTAAFDVDYVVMFNNTPVFQQPLTFFGRVANSIEVPFSFAKRLDGPGLIQVRAVDAGASGPWVVGASLIGWITPTIDADRAKG